MAIRRFFATGAAIGLLFAMAIPVVARDPNSYVATTLVTGPSPDTDLVNAWGLTRGPASPWWVADNGTDLSTLYLADGSKLALRVTIPGGVPTGAVFNGNGAAGDFGGDNFLFSSEAGIISAWRGALGTTAEIGNDDFEGDAVFKGLAIGTADVGDGAQQYLYATDFHNGQVDVFDRTFASQSDTQSWDGAFVDPMLPKGYAPFGIQTLNGMVFVTFAKSEAGSDDEAAGQGRGIVDSFATDGTFLGRVATHGLLNAPWGLAWAPGDFGRFSGDLLVGNFGDGKLIAYRWNGQAWHQDGQLRGANDEAIVIDGLWAIAFGGGQNLVNDGPANTLFFTAGPNEEEGGAFGTITAATP